jgi:hypothetical protein
VNHHIKRRQTQLGFEIQIDHVQPRIGKRNVFSVTAGPNLNVAIQEQLAHYANCEWRRGAGDEDSHHLRRLQPE